MPQMRSAWTFNAYTYAKSNLLLEKLMLFVVINSVKLYLTAFNEVLIMYVVYKQSYRGISWYAIFVSCRNIILLNN